jgi:hypothetical protein
MILSKNLPHHDEDQILKQIYDFYIEIKDDKMNPLFIISQQFELRENLYHVHWGNLNSGKHNMLLPVNNLFKYNEQLEYPITYPRELRDKLNISDIDKARRFYNFKVLDVDMYLQDKEDLFHYKTDKLTTELTKIQEYINKTNRERISVSHVDKFLNDDNFLNDDKFLNQELFNSKNI